MPERTRSGRMNKLTKECQRMISLFRSSFFFYQISFDPYSNRNIKKKGQSLYSLVDENER
jgi:hypothetical protein